MPPHHRRAGRSTTPRRRPIRCRSTTWPAARPSDRGRGRRARAAGRRRRRRPPRAIRRRPKPPRTPSTKPPDPAPTAGAASAGAVATRWRRPGRRRRRGRRPWSRWWTSRRQRRASRPCAVEVLESELVELLERHPPLRSGIGIERLVAQRGDRFAGGEGGRANWSTRRPAAPPPRQGRRGTPPPCPSGSGSCACMPPPTPKRRPCPRCAAA